MEKENKGESCGSHSSSCCEGKKFLIGFLAGVLLTTFAFGFFMAGQCAARGWVCPFSQMPR